MNSSINLHNVELNNETFDSNLVQSKTIEASFNIQSNKMISNYDTSDYSQNSIYLLPEAKVNCNNEQLDNDMAVKMNISNNMDITDSNMNDKIRNESQNNHMDDYKIPNIIQDSIDKLKSLPSSKSVSHTPNNISVRNNDTIDEKSISGTQVNNEVNDNGVNKIKLSNNRNVVISNLNGQIQNSTRKIQNLTQISLTKPRPSTSNSNIHIPNISEFNNELENMNHSNNMNINEEIQNDSQDKQMVDNKISNISQISVDNIKNPLSSTSSSHIPNNVTELDIDALDEYTNLDQLVMDFSELSKYKLEPYIKPNGCNKDSKVGFLENSAHNFSCFVCNQYKTNDENEFEKHFRDAHKGKRLYSCIYCCETVKISQTAHHLNTHKSRNHNSTAECTLCCSDINVMDISTIKKHLHDSHDNLRTCPFCNADFEDESDFDTHLNASINVLYICSSDNCRVMSHNKNEFMLHITDKKHTYYYSFYMNCIHYTRHFEDCCTFSSTGYVADIENVKFYNSDYCVEAFDLLFSDYPEEIKNEMKEKMDRFKNIDFGIGFYKSNKKRVFLCGTCNYHSDHSISDLKKHLLGLHCSIGTKYIKTVLSTCKYDENYKLNSSLQIIRSINVNRKSANLPLIGDGDLIDFKVPEPSRKRKSSNCNGSFSQKKEKLSEIQPNFSEFVLGELCSGSLFSSYELLKAKLSIISTLKGIYIEEDGKRKLQCSACPEYKKEKFSDIYNHFMIHHAQIPVNLRPVAKACSKTDRFYNLLPDEELIKLSKDTKSK